MVPEIGAPRALIFRPLVKRNEDSENEMDVSLNSEEIIADFEASGSRKMEVLF